jgi:hypothetical protein
VISGITREPPVSIETAVVLEAMIALLELKQPDAAEAYARTVIGLLERHTEPESTRREIELSLSPEAVRARRYRDRKRDGKRDDRDGKRDASRDASRSVAPSRAPVDLDLKSLSYQRDQEEITERERESERERNVTVSVTRHVTPVTRFSLEPESGVKLKRRAERPPPSGTPDTELRSWLRSRGLPEDHPATAEFLDVFRNAKPKLDWPACWRNFLTSKAEGRFAPARTNGAAPAPVKPKPMSPQEIDKAIEESYKILGRNRQ